MVLPSKAITTLHDPSIVEISPPNTDQADLKLTKGGIKPKAKFEKENIQKSHFNSQINQECSTDLKANDQQIENDEKSHSVKHQVQQQPKSKTALKAKCENDKSTSVKLDTQQQQSKGRTTSQSVCETYKNNSNIISQQESTKLTKENSASEQKTHIMEGICSNLEDENCNTLLQIQEVSVSNPKTLSLQTANILWDGGSTLSFITNSLAKQQLQLTFLMKVS